MVPTRSAKRFLPNNVMRSSIRFSSRGKIGYRGPPKATKNRKNRVSEHRGAKRFWNENQLCEVDVSPFKELEVVELRLKKSRN